MPRPFDRREIKRGLQMASWSQPHIRRLVLVALGDLHLLHVSSQLAAVVGVEHAEGGVVPGRPGALDWELHGGDPAVIIWNGKQ